MPGLPAANHDAASKAGSHAKKCGQLEYIAGWNIPLITDVKHTMKMKNILRLLLFSILIFSFISLAGCRQADTDNGNDSNNLDVTQAYQTVDAQLTQAVGQTPVPPTTTTLPLSLTATSIEQSTLVPPTATSTPSGPTATFSPTFTHTPATRCDQAEAAYPTIDITIPDDTTIPAGNAFTKVWRVVNTGSCNWTAEYAVVFFSGEQMDAPDEVFIDQPVAPGQSIDIDVTMVAPPEKGTYQGNWMLQNPSGDLFGLGPNANDSFWVRIVVVEPEDTPTPTATQVPSPDVLVSGSVTLNPNESIDLDSLQLGIADTDMTYAQIIDNGVVTGHQLNTISGAISALFGSSQPDYGSCLSASMATLTIDLQAAGSGTYYCYTTNQGLIGWLRFDGLDDVTNQVTITILTWASVE
jgi:hypothetical protein